MAGQVQDATKGATDKVPGGGIVKGAQDKVQGLTSGLLSSIEGYAATAAMWVRGLLDRFFPPEQRASLLAKLQAFMLKNPKLSTFLGMNLALSGIPLGLFILFTLTVAIFSLVVGLLLGLLGAVIFIVLAVGAALTIVLPSVFFTTMTACFLFLWGLGGYYILKWANGDKAMPKEGQEGSGGSIGEGLNSLTGGRLTGFMDAAKAERAKGGIEGYSDQYTKPAKAEQKEEKKEEEEKKEDQQHHREKPQSNGSAHKHVEDAGSTATKATGVDGVAKHASGVTGTVRGGLGGATGVNA